LTEAADGLRRLDEIREMGATLSALEEAIAEAKSPPQTPTRRAPHPHRRRARPDIGTHPRDEFCAAGRLHDAVEAARGGERRSKGREQ
jgi:hypothetical protein